MENQKRIQEIERLQSIINPLNYERIFLETSLQFTKEKYFKEFKEEDKLKIIEINTKLDKIYGQLNPAFEELRKVQCKYEIEYEGQVYDEYSNSYQWNKEHEILNLTTCCDLNTFDNGWEPYQADGCVSNLISEIHSVIYNLRYSNFNIKNIKRIS